MNFLPDSVTSIESLGDDDEKRNRNKFYYSHDVLTENCAAPNSMWPLSNDCTKMVIDKELEYNDLPYDEGNEEGKGEIFTELKQFVATHNSEPLCEVLNNQSCLKEKCPLYKKEDGSIGGICREFKMVFKKI